MKVRVVKRQYCKKYEAISDHIFFFIVQQPLVD